MRSVVGGRYFGYDFFYGFDFGWLGFGNSVWCSNGGFGGLVWCFKGDGGGGGVVVVWLDWCFWVVGLVVVVF